MILTTLFAIGLSALAVSPAISYQFSQVTSPNGEAYLVLTADAPASGIEVAIQGSDGSKIRRTISIGASGETRIPWKQKAGNVHYQVQLSSGGEPLSEFEFDVRKPSAAGALGKLKVNSSAEDIVDYHRVQYQSSFDFNAYTFQVWGIDGNKIDEQDVTGVSVAAGTPLNLSWQSDDDVFMLSMRAQDEAGRFAEDRVVPWSVDVPHKDITFVSGKWDIRESQRPALDESFAVLVHELDRLERANAAVNGDIKAQIYVIGYTDTVGDAASNQTLSENRARAIAEYFAKAGAWCEIWYAGMGERGLAVQTPDSTDMEANRRAAYVVGVNKPSGPKMPSAGAFRKLRDASARNLSSLPELPASYFDHQEKVRAARIAKRGGPASSRNRSSAAEEESHSSPGLEELHSDREVDTSFDALADGGSDNQPPKSDAKPGATAKGCTIGSKTPAAWYLAIFVVMAWIRRRAGK